MPGSRNVLPRHSTKPSPLCKVDIEITPCREFHWVAGVVFKPRMADVGRNRVGQRHPRIVGVDQLIEFEVQLLARRRVGQGTRLLILLVIGGQIEARVVSAAGVGAVQQLVKVVTIGEVSDPVTLEHLHLADAGRLDDFGLLVGLENDAQADRVEVLAPQFVAQAPAHGRFAVH